MKRLGTHSGVVLKASGNSNPKLLEGVEYATVIVIQRLETFRYCIGEIVMPERRLQTLRAIGMAGEGVDGLADNLLIPNS